MFNLKRLTQSRAARNAGSSYFAFVSTSISGLVSIPIAVKYLDKPQIGLWSIVYMLVGYLLWMDLGVGDATGRKMADAIAKEDPVEINRWWTSSMVVLGIQGVLMMALAVGLSPFLVGFLRVQGSLATDALWLFLGAAVVAALSMPVRAYPGILLAQERFHWVPLVQGIIPWIQLGCFTLFLHLGHGIRSYVWAISISQSTSWLIFIYQVHRGKERFSWDMAGLEKARLVSLFSYSGSIALNGIATSILQSLPSMMLARMGGVAMVPLYNFSARGPSMVCSLTGRTSYAFYPNLQRLYVSDEKERFRAKYKEVALLSMAVSWIGAGAILAGNRSLIEWLAGTDYYAGTWTNAWLANSVILMPLVSGFMSLLQYSGSMGKVAWWTSLQVVVGIGASWWAFKAFGLPGLAAVFALIPLILQAPYALLRGSRNCGFSPIKLVRNVLIAGVFGFAIILLGSWWISQETVQNLPVSLLGRSTRLPNPVEWYCSFILAIPGAAIAWNQLRRIKNI
jgi:O-antigen/teichoic acid export membrane protein